MRPGFLSKLKATVGDRNVPALQLWIACNFVSMALILVLGMRLGWAFFASHASLLSLSWGFVWTALVSNVWLLAAIIVVRLVMAWLAYSVLDGLRSSEAAARQVAGRDALSGLPNRFLFNALVDAEIAPLQARTSPVRVVLSRSRPFQASQRHFWPRCRRPSDCRRHPTPGRCLTLLRSFCPAWRR